MEFAGCSILQINRTKKHSGKTSLPTEALPQLADNKATHRHGVFTQIDLPVAYPFPCIYTFHFIVIPPYNNLLLSPLCNKISYLKGTPSNKMVANNFPINIVVADSNIITLNGLEVTLNDQPSLTVVGKANDFENLRSLAYTKQPEIIITNCKLPGINEPANIQALCNESNAAVILYEHNINAQYLPFYTSKFVQGIICRHHRYIDLLMDAIHTVYAGRHYQCPATKRFFGNNTRRIKRILSLFSSREMEVLQLISEQKTTLQIAKLIFASKDCVESIRRRLIQRTTSKNIIGVIQFAIKYNIISLETLNG